MSKLKRTTCTENTPKKTAKSPNKTPKRKNQKNRTTKRSRGPTRSQKTENSQTTTKNQSTKKNQGDRKNKINTEDDSKKVSRETEEKRKLFELFLMRQFKRINYFLKPYDHHIRPIEFCSSRSKYTGVKQDPHHSIKVDPEIALAWDQTQPPIHHQDFFFKRISAQLGHIDELFAPA